MIYRINLIAGGTQRRFSIYAHPAWPFVMDNSGDPTDEFRVSFLVGEDSSSSAWEDKLDVQVLRRVCVEDVLSPMKPFKSVAYRVVKPIEEANKLIRLRGDWITSIQKISDLSTL